MRRILRACRQLTTAGLLAYFGFLPSLAAGALAMLTGSLRTAVLLGALAGLTAGPGLGGLYATARHSLRGRRSRWNIWRWPALKNPVPACLLGAVSVALLCGWQTSVLLAGGVRHAPWPLWAGGWGLVVCLNAGWARLAGGAKRAGPLRSLAGGSLHFAWWAALCIGFPLSYVVVLPFGYGPLLAAVLAVQSPPAARRRQGPTEKTPRPAGQNRGEMGAVALMPAAVPTEKTPPTTTPPTAGLPTTPPAAPPSATLPPAAPPLPATPPTATSPSIAVPPAAPTMPAGQSSSAPRPAGQNPAAPVVHRRKPTGTRKR